MKWSKYNYIYKSKQHGTLLFNTLSGAFFDISDPDTEKEILRLKETPDQYDFSDDKENYDALVSSGVICHSDKDNKNIIDYSLLASRFNSKYKDITILPTLNCNLACTYCFEESNRCDVVMSPEVIEKLKKYIKEKYAVDNDPINLHWFGGEPLMGFHIMEEISQYIDSLGVPYNASVITNGILLTEQKIDKLGKLHINYIQITLDGNKETHDTKRVFKNGQGTYDIIMSNLSKLHQAVEADKKISVQIRINVDKENRDQYHILFKEFAQKFPLFQVYPGIITQYKTCSNTLPCFANHREEGEFYIEQYEKYGIVHPEFNITLKGMKSCMAERIHADLIGPRGEFYMCLQDVGDKEAEVGSIEEGKNNIHRISAYCSGNLTFNSDECRDCNVLTFCGGGCVNKRYRNIKNEENHSMCAAYKDKDMFERYLDLHYEIKKRYAKQ